MDTHFKTVYSCGHIYLQCRCPSPDKTITTLAYPCQSCLKNSSKPLNKSQFAQILFEALEDVGSRPSPLCGAHVVHVDDGVQVTTLNGDVFRLIVKKEGDEYGT